MKKFVLAAALAVAPVIAFSTTVGADSPGQLQNSDNFYKVKNVTKGTAYAKTASATCGDTVQYSIMIANGEYGMLSDVMVKTTLAGATTVSATNAAGQTTSTSGSVSVNLDKGSLAYVAGSTKNYAENGSLIKSLADGITTSGVNKGGLAGSTAEFVNFQAKVECETVQPKDIKVCDLASKTIITIKEDQFDASKHTRDLNKCAPAQPGEIKVCVTATKEIVTIKENEFDASKHSKDLNTCNVVVEAPAAIASTGPTGTIASMFGLSALAAGVTYVARARRNLLG